VKILGLAAPLKVVTTDPMRATPYELKELSLAELQVRAARIAEQFGVALERKK
jgi:hypothetical protein